MKTATATLKSIAPYSQSRMHATDKIEKESHDAYEKRTWREKCHSNGDGNMFIPPMAFKFAIQRASEYLSEKIPGKGQATFSKHFKSGILVMEPLHLPVAKDTVEGEWLFVNSDGKRGSGKRVFRCFPVVREWSGQLVFHVLDDTITKDAFERTLREAGNFIGVGRFRPENGGFYGRFEVGKIAWG